jgi:RecG-like helicase
MKKTMLAAVAVAALMFAQVCTARAADAKEKTITGEGKCAKCALKETKTCQNVIQVKEGGKKVTYYLVHNDVSKKFHENICQGTKKVKATGKVKKVDGKLELTPTKIDLVKD